MACTQARVSYNLFGFLGNFNIVVACTQARVSYNMPSLIVCSAKLWLALRHGLVTIIRLEAVG